MMDKILFTKREQQVMELLWNSADSLSAHDLVEKSGLSVYTVQQPSPSRNIENRCMKCFANRIHN